MLPQEAEQLFEALRKMAAQEKGIVFISHKLDEVMALADEVDLRSRRNQLERHRLLP